MQEEFLVIDRHWQQVLKYISQHKLKNFPVHIFIGKENTGKSSLLKHAEVNFDLIVPGIKNYKKNLINDQPFSENHQWQYEPSEYCHWWIDKKGIILEIPSTFLSTENDLKNPAKWQYLLKLLRRQKKHLSVCSITYFVDVGFLVSLKNEIDLSIIYEHKRIILEFCYTLGIKPPLYFLITKCDFIQGFSEFFDDLRSDERTQCLGCSLENDNNSNDLGINQTLTDIFNINFDKLLKQLNAHIINRLNNERNLTKRTIINEFPLQLETLQDAIAFLLEEIGEKTLYCDVTKPQGVYFTSSLQTTFSCDLLLQSLSQSYEFTEQPYITALTYISRPYFIKSFVSDLLTSAEVVKTNSEKWLQSYRFNQLTKSQLITTISAAVFVLFTLSIVTWQYQSERTIINSAKDNVRKLESELASVNQKKTTIHQTLRYFNALNTLDHDNQQANNSRLHLFHPGSHRILTEKIDKISSKLLLLQVKQELENDLLNELDPKRLYQAHKAYWQITHENKTPNNDLTIWAMNHWNKLTDSDRNNIYAAIKKLGVIRTASVKRNDFAFERAHSILSNIPTAYFAYLNLIDKTNPVNVSNVTQGVPFVYTKDGFQKFLSNLSELTIDEHLSFVKQHENHNLSHLQIEILELYFKDYGNYWNHFISETFYNPKQLSDILKQLKFYTNNPSALKEKIEFIVNNVSGPQLISLATRIAPELSTYVKEDIDKTITPMFQTLIVGLSQVVSDPKQFNSIINNFKQLYEYLQVLNDTSNQAQMGFELAALHAKRQNLSDPLNTLFNLPSGQSPLIQTWLQKTAENTWANILDLAHHYINERWQQEVIPFYNTAINNHYPVFNTSTADISLSDFEQFFSSEGILSKFFEHYLSPFIDTSSIQWQWRNINNQAFASDTTLPQLFERARIIRQMFFTDNKFDFHFTLTATSVEPVINKIELNFGEKPLIITPGKHMQADFTWPAKQDRVSLNIYANNNQPVVSNEKSGTFALFRLLNDTGIQTTNDPKRYIITFNVNNNLAAQFQLQTENLINPFIPNIIEQFRCPEALF
ncbi:MAG: type VI secretion system membrane subunit TssM [Gammaproteobacteria bacterium]